MSARNENAPLQRGELCATTTKHDPKHSATFCELQLQLANRGHSLRETTNPGGATVFIVSKWGLYRELRDLAAVTAFAKLVGCRV